MGEETQVFEPTDRVRYRHCTSTRTGTISGTAVGRDDIYLIQVDDAHVEETHDPDTLVIDRVRENEVVERV